MKNVESETLIVKSETVFNVMSIRSEITDYRAEWVSSLLSLLSVAALNHNVVYFQEAATQRNKPEFGVFDTFFRPTEIKKNSVIISSPKGSNPL